MTKEKLFSMITLTALAVAFLSGILVAVFPEVMAWTLLHKLSAVILVVGTIVHVWQLLSALQKAQKGFTTGSLERSFTRSIWTAL